MQRQLPFTVVGIVMTVVEDVVLFEVEDGITLGVVVLDVTSFFFGLIEEPLKN